MKRCLVLTCHDSQRAGASKHVAHRYQRSLCRLARTGWNAGDHQTAWRASPQKVSRKTLFSNHRCRRRSAANGMTTARHRAHFSDNGVHQRLMAQNQGGDADGRRGRRSSQGIIAKPKRREMNKRRDAGADGRWWRGDMAAIRRIFNSSGWQTYVSNDLGNNSKAGMKRRRGINNCETRSCSMESATCWASPAGENAHRAGIERCQQARTGGAENAWASGSGALATPQAIGTYAKRRGVVAALTPAAALVATCVEKTAGAKVT